jgi:hypothetical protein
MASILEVWTDSLLTEDAFLWLLRGDLQRGTESEIIATQDQALQNKYHAIKILQTETDSTCRLCKNLMIQ